MTKVLQVDASAADAWVEKDLGAPVADFWVTADLYIPAATLAQLATAGNQWIFNVLLADDTQADLVGSRLGNWRDFNGDNGGAIPADTWITCELHHVTSPAFGDFLVGGSSQFTPFDPTGLDAQKVQLGLTNSALATPYLFYIRNVKFGTTQGASDLGADDFSSGDLSAWDSSSGDVSVIDDPTGGGGPATVPDAPTLDSAAFTAPTEVTLSWTPGDDGGSAITGYNIYRGTTTGGETLLDTVGAVTSYVDTSPAAFDYFYEVTAVNAVGESAVSNEIEALLNAPDAPTLDTAAGAVGGVDLGWIPPGDDGGTSVTAYKVYRGTASGGETLLTTVGAVTTYTDTTATPGTEYFYEVTAINAVGEGPLSNELSATVPQLGPFFVAFDDSTLEPDPSWTDIGGGSYRLAQRFQTARGRQSELDKTGTGTAAVDTVDINGVLDPTNAGSPFTGKLDPMKQARIAIVNPWKLLNDNDQTLYSLFRGFVDTWGDFDVDQSGNFITGQVQLVDALDLFAALRLMPGSHGDTPPAGAADVYYAGGPNGYSAGTNVSVQDRIYAILDDIGWPAALRNVFTGNVRVLEQVYARADQALSALDDAADAEFPFVANRFMSKDGVFDFRGRFARFFPEHYGVNTWLLGGRPQAEADPDNVVLISRLPAFRRSAQDIINAALAIPSGAADTDVPGNLVTDPTSIGQFGYRSLNTADLLTYEGLAGGVTNAIDETRKFADYRVGNYKDSQTRVGQIVVVGRDPRDRLAKPLWDFLCRVELGDIVTLTTTHPGGGGFDEDFYVESISYDGEPAPAPKYYHLVCTLDVSPRRYFDYNPFGDDPIS